MEALFPVMNHILYIYILNQILIIIRGIAPVPCPLSHGFSRGVNIKCLDYAGVLLKWELSRVKQNSQVLRCSIIEY